MYEYLEIPQPKKPEQIPPNKPNSDSDVYSPIEDDINNVPGAPFHIPNRLPSKDHHDHIKHHV
ncbi:MAG: hypothetical protein ACK5Z5_10065 [Neisseriaceae bacterium]